MNSEGNSFQYLVSVLLWCCALVVSSLRQGFLCEFRLWFYFIKYKLFDPKLDMLAITSLNF